MKKARGLINYCGNKEKLLPTISQYFPKHYNRFVDAFCGGLSVSLYVEGDVLANDYDHRLIEAYKAIDAHPNPVSTIKRIIAENGLNKEDKDAYIAFRKKYNENPDPLSLFILIQHSFSNINRHNRKGEFNANFGRRTFNENAVERVLNFKEENKDGRINFTSGRYDEIEILPGDFVYSDIPYLITSAEYNKLWSVEELKFTAKLYIFRLAIAMLSLTVTVMYMLLKAVRLRLMLNIVHGDIKPLTWIFLILEYV